MLPASYDCLVMVYSLKFSGFKSCLRMSLLHSNNLFPTVSCKTSRVVIFDILIVMYFLCLEFISVKSMRSHYFIQNKSPIVQHHLFNSLSYSKTSSLKCKKFDQMPKPFLEYLFRSIGLLVYPCTNITTYLFFQNVLAILKHFLFLMNFRISL